MSDDYDGIVTGGQPDPPSGEEILANIRRAATDIRAAEIARAEMKRTYVFADPDRAVEFEAYAAAHGLDDVVTVHSSPYLPDGWAGVVIDEQGLEAQMREDMQRSLRRGLWL